MGAVRSGSGTSLSGPVVKIPCLQVRGIGLIPGWKTETPPAVQQKKKKEEEEEKSVTSNFPGGTEDRSPPANAENPGLIPGPGRFYLPRSN